jgi:hypothetical protein
MHSKPLLIDIQVNNVSYLISLSSAHEQYIRAKAMEFCVEHMADFKINTQSLAESCAVPMAKQLSEDVKAGHGVFLSDVSKAAVANTAATTAATTAASTAATKAVPAVAVPLDSSGRVVASAPAASAQQPALVVDGVFPLPPLVSSTELLSSTLSASSASTIPAIPAGKNLAFEPPSLVHVSLTR